MNRSQRSIDFTLAIFTSLIALTVQFSTAAAEAHRGYRGGGYSTYSTGYDTHNYTSAYYPGSNYGGGNGNYGGANYGGGYGNVGRSRYTTQNFSGPAYIGPSGYNAYVQNYAIAPSAPPEPMQELRATAQSLRQ